MSGRIFRSALVTGLRGLTCGLLLSRSGEPIRAERPFAALTRAKVKIWMGPGEPMASTGTMTNTLVRLIVVRDSVPSGRFVAAPLCARRDTTSRTVT